MYETVMIYWQLNKLTGRTGQWMVRSERVNRVYSDEDESPPGRPPFMIVRTFLHICSQICNAFFPIQINCARLFTTYVSKCWVFLVFHLGCVFFPACDTAALRQKKYNPFEQILLRTSIWEFNHFFLRSKTFTLCNDTHTECVQSMLCCTLNSISNGCA